MSKRNYIIPIFVPHLGCPHDCVFCNQEEITGVKRGLGYAEVIKKVDSYLETIPKRANNIEVAFYGGSFTGIDPLYQRELLKAAKDKLLKGDINGVRLSTRPDYIDEKVLDYLEDYGVTAIELGVQSLDEKVLKAAGRGHNREVVLKAVDLIKEYNFQLGLQIMPGLPGSSRESDFQTVKEIIQLKPDFVRIYPTLVIKGTQLASLYKSGHYIPLSLEDGVEISSTILEELNKAQIKVIRVGLQPSEGVNDDEVIAGPFHPSFRQIVESRIMLKKVEEKIDDNPIKTLTITVNSKDISNLRGQKNHNIDTLNNKYPIEEIIIKRDDTLERGSVIVEAL
ncbi:elongator complex protein 3 [Halonatronum saccharophilum]|uniref:elongator complex protein 3 n=1 Tax=Halonatronum saccharophilum TaxID=150060 RepID=UPI00048980C2|nr:radical SAM protein [Halonatronum saccharophilum]